MWSCETGTNVDVRHVALQRESPRRDIAHTLNHMIACAASSTRDRGKRRHVIPRFCRAFLHSRDTAELNSITEQGGDARTMIGGVFYNLEKVCRLWLCNCAMVRQSVSPNKFRKANGSITMMNLRGNNIGHKGTIALAECLKATLVTCFSGARDTV